MLKLKKFCMYWETSGASKKKKKNRKTPTSVTLQMLQDPFSIESIKPYAAPSGLSGHITFDDIQGHRVQQRGNLGHDIMTSVRRSVGSVHRFSGKSFLQDFALCLSCLGFAIHFGFLLLLVASFFFGIEVWLF